MVARSGRRLILVGNAPGHPSAIQTSPSIITSLILFWFGSTFGATLVKGFALTLALGVLVSLFTAVFVTRSLLAVILDFIKQERAQKWFGL